MKYKVGDRLKIRKRIVDDAPPYSVLMRVGTWVIVREVMHGDKYPYWVESRKDRGCAVSARELEAQA